MPEYFFSLLQTILSLFFLLMCGFVLRKLGVINDNASKFLSRLLVLVGQPMMLIHSLYTAPFSLENLKLGLCVLFLSIAVHAFMAVIAFFACKWIRDLNERKILEFAMIFGNVGFIGFPLLDVLLPENGRFMGAFLVFGFHVVLWSWGVLIFARKRPDIRITPRKLVLNYGTIPCLIGLSLYLIFGALRHFAPGFVIPSALTSFTRYLSDMAVPVSLMITGSLLATRTPKQIFGDPKTYFVSGMKLVVMPLAVCLVMKLLGFSADMCIFITTCCATPVAAMVSVLSELYDVNPGYSSQSVGTTTVLCVATLPIVIPLAELLIAL